MSLPVRIFFHGVSMSCLRICDEERGTAKSDADVTCVIFVCVYGSRSFPLAGRLDLDGWIGRSSSLRQLCQTSFLSKCLLVVARVLYQIAPPQLFLSEFDAAPADLKTDARGRKNATWPEENRIAII